MYVEAVYVAADCARHKNYGYRFYAWGDFFATATVLAHPQNNFWKFMSVLFPEINLNQDYEVRVAKLLKNHVGLWDALKHCDRDGSMDSAIRQAEPNDFSDLLNMAPALSRLVFNGKKAYQSFVKSSNLLWAEKNSIEHILLPSTSPANASTAYDKKLELWAKALKIS